MLHLCTIYSLHLKYTMETASPVFSFLFLKPQVLQISVPFQFKLVHTNTLHVVRIPSIHTRLSSWLPRSIRADALINWVLETNPHLSRLQYLVTSCPKRRDLSLSRATLDVASQEPWHTCNSFPPFRFTLSRLRGGRTATAPTFWPVCTRILRGGPTSFILMSMSQVLIY